MNNLLIIQLISSFVVGGGIVAIISFIAEKVSARVAGIILTFPSTIALGFFFIGWTTSSETVAEIVPATLIPLGLTVLFPVIYIKIAKKSSKLFEKKVLQITFTIIVSVFIWLLLALPMAIFKFSNLTIGIVAYVLLAIFSNYLLHREKVKKPISLKYSLNQKIGRAIFVGSIITLIVLLAKTMNPFWGAIFTMFPAAFLSLLILFHWYYDAENLLPVVQKVAIGSISLFAYAITSMIVFPKIGFIIGTLVAFIISSLTTLLLTKLR